VVAAHEPVEQRDIWLADLPQPVGSEAGFRRPVIIVQADALNTSRMRSCLAIPITSVATRGHYPWNMSLPENKTGWMTNSIAQCNLMLAVDEGRLIEKIGRITPSQLRQLFACLDIVLGRA